MKKKVTIILIASVFLIYNFPLLIHGQRIDIEQSFNRGVYLIELGQYDQAIEHFQRIIENNPEYEPAYTYLGIAYHKKVLYDKAIETLKKAVKLDPNDNVARSWLGNTYTDSRLYDEAIVEQKNIIKVDPNNEAAFNDLGFAYLEKRDYEEAIRYFKQALSINPVRKEPRYNLGYSYYKRKKWIESIDELLYARDIYVHDPKITDCLKSCAKKSYTYVKKWAEQKPMDPLAHYYFSIALSYGKGNNQQAIKEINKSIELDNSNAQFYKTKGLFYYYLQNWEAAATALQKGITVDSSNWVCDKILGEITAFQFGNYYDGLSLAITASNINPEVISVQLLLGSIYGSPEIGQYEKALEALQKAISLGAQDSVLYYNLAATYYNLKMFEKAWAYTRRSEMLGNRDAMALIQLLQSISKEP